MEVYLDVILIENFVIDYFLLLLSFNMMRLKVSNKKIICGAAIGSIYTIVMIFESLEFFSCMPFQILAAYIIVLIALGIRKIRLAAKTSIVYLFNAFILSGICYYMCQKELGYSFVNGTVINNFSSKYILISLMIIYISVDRILVYLREKNIVGNFIFNVEINIDNKRYVIKGFLDTGNELREPVTNLPCILVEEDIFYDFKIPKDNLYYINYSAIGYNGKLKGFKVDNVKIYSNDNNYKEINAIICPCKEVLNKDREFNALLSRGVM